MKLLYINVGGSAKISSIYKKIFGQIEGLRNHGVDAQGVFLSPEIKEEIQIHKYVKIIPVKTPKNPLFYQLKLRKIYEEDVAKILNETEAEIVYLRYFWASKKVVKILRNCGKKVVLERNSLLLSEIKASNQKTLQLNLSFFLSQLQDYWFPYFQEKVWGKRLNKVANLVVCVTPQILNQYEEVNANCIHLGNGIATNNFPQREENTIKEKIIFFILDGTSVFAPWKGTKRLIESIQKHGLEDNVEVHIAGNESSFKGLSFVKTLGYLSSEEIHLAISKAHIGTGNLNLAKKNLYDGSTLKTREYASRGIPILLAHNDFDIENTELNDFCNKVSNSSDILPLPTIIEWIKKLYKVRPNHPREMHNLAKQHLDFMVKMKELKSVLETL